MAATAIRTLCSSIALMALVLTPTSRARAQFKTDEIDQTLRAQGRVIQKYASDPASDPAKKELFENYITKYYIPKMTRSDADGLGELGKDRYELFRQYVWPAHPTVQKWLTSTLLQRMKAIYQDPTYHPSVRYNAVLILGMLDDEYGVDSGANSRPPKPSAEANTELVFVLSGGLKKASVSPAMIVGALIGLERHAKYRASLPQPAQDTLAKGFMAVMARDKFPQEMGNDVRNWIRVQAAAGLATMASVGENGQFHQAMMKLIDDPTLGIENRCQVAALLAKIPYKQGDPIDGPTAVKSLTQLAVDYAADEAKTALKYEDLHVKGTVGFYPGGSDATIRGFRIVKDQIVYERRRPVACLSDLLAGMRALVPAVPADQQQVLQALQQAMKPVMDTCMKKDSLELDVVNQIQTMSNEFNRIAPSAGSKPVEVEKEEAEEGLF